MECKDQDSIYAIPGVLHREGLDAHLVRKLNVPFHDVDWSEWNQVLNRVQSPRHRVEVALVGKYVDLHDAYLSVSEALKAGGFKHWTQVDIRWVASDSCQSMDEAGKALAGVDAVLVPGGFGVRGIDGKLGALRWARENKIPTLGICLGLQCMVIEAARNLCHLTEASSTEMDPSTSYPLVTTMDEQHQFVTGGGDLGGTMRLGSYPAKLASDSLVAQVYGQNQVTERHRHRFEVNTHYRQQLAEAGLRFSGTSPDGTLVEFVELDPKLHPYYLATQAHPEFKSRPTSPHPLFSGLIAAALKRQSQRYRKTQLASENNVTED